MISETELKDGNLKEKKVTGRIYSDLGSKYNSFLILIYVYFLISLSCVCIGISVPKTPRSITLFSILLFSKFSIKCPKIS
jgi:hypothetical protein